MDDLDQIFLKHEPSFSERLELWCSDDTWAVAGALALVFAVEEVLGAVAASVDDGVAHAQVFLVGPHHLESQARETGGRAQRRQRAQRRSLPVGFDLIRH